MIEDFQGEIWLYGMYTNLIFGHLDLRSVLFPRHGRLIGEYIQDVQKARIFNEINEDRAKST